MGKILPLLLVIIGIGGGGVLGHTLRPPAIVSDEPETSPDVSEISLEDPELLGQPAETPDEPGYVRINNQFVVPVIEDEKVTSLVVLSISLETEATMTESVYEREPKLRDAFLQVLFDHAYIGGFNGVYTTSPLMEALKSSLLVSARRVIGDSVTRVLITDILRQEL